MTSPPDDATSIEQLDRCLIECLVQRRQRIQADPAANAPPGTLGPELPARLLEIGTAAGIAPDALVAWWKHTDSLCQVTAADARVAYLGPAFSYSYLATVQYFGQAAALAPVHSIAAVFEAVENGECYAGVVPLENSTDGRIVDTLGQFVQHRTNICGEVLLPIHHNLLATVPREQITHICSKPQALSQCRHWLSRHLPNAKLQEVASTTEAARRAAEAPGIAAVASQEAGRQYGLQVIAANIEDNRNNVTRFAIIGRQQPAPTTADKTTLLMQLRHQPGALADVMNIFKKQQINLTWIESFPIAGQVAEYFFFVECEGHRERAPVQETLQHLAHETKRLDVLGSYPAAKSLQANPPAP